MESKQSNGVRVVLNLLRERIGQPRKAPGMHPQVQVLPFGKRRTDMVRVRIAFDYRLARTDAHGGSWLSELRRIARAFESFVHADNMTPTRS